MARPGRGRADVMPEGSIYDIPFEDAKGKTRTLGEFRGEVLLIVNTASY
jgi:glutathione peroxidase-family protein